MGFKLKNPIIAGSTGLSMSVENLKSLEKHGAAAVVLKSLFEEQIMHEVNKALAGTDNKDISYYPEAEDYIRHYTKEKDLNDYLRLIENGKKSISIPLIASINCFSASNGLHLQKRLKAPAPMALS